MLEFGSLPLGVSADAAYRTRRVQTVPGAMLVLYTDGALEHSRNVLEGEELLLEATTQAGGSSEVDAASIIHNAIFSGRAVGDDVAILTIGFSSSGDGSPVRLTAASNVDSQDSLPPVRYRRN
jgi:hypothetical protein